MYRGRIGPGSRGVRNLPREIGTRASTYASVWQDEGTLRVHQNDGMGVLEVLKRTEAVRINSLNISRNNSACSHDHQARRSAGDRGQEQWRQEAEPNH